MYGSLTVPVPDIITGLPTIVSLDSLFTSLL